MDKLLAKVKTHKLRANHANAVAVTVMVATAEVNAMLKVLMHLQAKTSKACKPIRLLMRQRLPSPGQHLCSVLWRKLQ
jgi:hypothetical protein